METLKEKALEYLLKVYEKAKESNSLYTPINYERETDNIKYLMNDNYLIYYNHKSFCLTNKGIDTVENRKKTDTILKS